MNKVKRQLIAILLVICVCISNFSAILAEEVIQAGTTNKKVAGQITLAIEKFTLGQGYYLEPVNVDFYEGETFGEVLARVLKKGTYNEGKDTDCINYLDTLYDPNPGEVNIPDYILDKIDEPDEFVDDDWLGSNDYYDMLAGWTYIDNNEMPMFTMDACECKDGDVFRIQFSIYAGSDIGFDMFGGTPILNPAANKDKLTRLIADINGRTDKETFLAKDMPIIKDVTEGYVEDTTIKDWYDTAIETLKYMEADQETVDLNYEILKAATDYKEVAGDITLAIEKFTLGQGYYLEPQNVPFYKGETLGNVVARVLGDGKYNNGINSENINYISSLYEPHIGEVNIPEYILEAIKNDAYDNNLLGNTDEWLGEKDYYSQAGWMYYINHDKLSPAMNEYICKPNDVVRMQYSVYGWGSDIGFGWDSSLITAANKDNLTRLVAAINSSGNKMTILSDTTIKAAYDEAVKVLTTLDAKQKAVNTAYAALKEASGITIIETETPPEEIEDPIETQNKNISEILATISEQYSSSSSEWSMMDMIAYGKRNELSQSDIDTYISKSKEKLLTTKSPTDFDKIAIIFTALGINAKKVQMDDGTTFDIIDRIATNSNIGGITGAAYALSAYDSGNYSVEEKVWTRENVITYIKEQQKTDGGWAFGSGNTSDPDVTGMVLTALAPYYLSGRYNVNECVEQGITCLSKMQKEDGGFASYGNKNANSAAKVIVALSALGIDSHTDERFIKGGNSVLDALLTYETESHVFGYTDNKKENKLATEQGFSALVCYTKLKELGEPFNLYKFDEITQVPDKPSEPEKPEEVEDGIVITEENKDILLPEGDQPLSYVLRTSQEAVLHTTPSILQVEGITFKTTTMPSLSVKKKSDVDQDKTEVELSIPAQTTVTGSSLWDGKITLPYVVSNPEIPGQKVNYTIKIGSDVDLTLSQPIRILFPNFKDKKVGYIGADGKYIEITNIMESDTAESLAEDKTEGMLYIGNDLCVWTKHLTLFVIGDKNNAEGSIPGGSHDEMITVSMKLIGDSFHTTPKAHERYETWISKTNYEIRRGSSVKELLEQALERAGISYRIDSDGYVREINGLGEFDNGPRSGWLYKVNGVDATMSCKDYELSSGDEVVWYYVDDYMKEGSNLGFDNSALIEEQLKEELKEEEKKEEQEIQSAEATEELVSFEDVPKDHWAIKAISYLVDRGIIEGRDSEHFAPNEKITRAEFISLLYRMSGQKAEKTMVTGFEDVKADFWFNDAVAWAVEAGITNGVDAKHFAPNQAITREQIAVLLAKYAEYMGLTLEMQGDKVVFKDNDKVSTYAKEAVSTMQQAGIISGREDGKFAPKDEATRAETAKMLAIFLQQIDK